jgi:hypothetical protein
MPSYIDQERTNHSLSWHITIFMSSLALANLLFFRTQLFGGFGTLIGDEYDSV